MSKQGKCALMIGVLALLGTAGWGSLGTFWGAPHTARYRTARVERGDIAMSVSATGTLNPVTTVQVSTQVSGMVAQIFVDFNAVVHEGQPIAQLDQATFRAKLTEAEARLETARAEVKHAVATVQQARAAVETARADIASQRADRERAQVAVVDAKRILERAQALFARQLSSRNDRETAHTQYDTAVAQHTATEAQVAATEAKLRSAQAQLHAADAQVEKAKAQGSEALSAVDQARIDLERTVIRSPISGMVISRSVDMGQTVAASLQAPTLFNIAHDLTHMQVDTNVSEADIGSVAPGQAVTFTVDAYPEQTFRGLVRMVRLAPIVVQNVVHYNTVIAVDNPGLQLKPGMTATVSILVAQHTNVLKVPKAALRFQPALTAHAHERLALRGGEPQPGGVPDDARQRRQSPKGPHTSGQVLPHVWVPTPAGVPQPLAVRVGLSDDQFTEAIDDRLQEGQEVIVGVHGKEATGRSSASASFPLSGPRERL